MVSQMWNQFIPKTVRTLPSFEVENILKLECDIEYGADLRRNPVGIEIRFFLLINYSIILFQHGSFEALWEILVYKD